MAGFHPIDATRTLGTLSPDQEVLTPTDSGTGLSAPSVASQQQAASGPTDSKGDAPTTNEVLTKVTQKVRVKK